MRINLISFLDPRVYGGGGEMISRRLVETGEAMGHDIRVASVRPRRLDGLHASADLSILIDVFNSGHTLRSLGAWRGFGKDFLEEVIQRAPFVHMTNAYVDVCNLPYLPCSGARSGDCEKKKDLGPFQRLAMRDWGKACFADSDLVRRLYSQARLNVYLSPLHQRTTERLLGEGNYAPGLVLRPMIDTATFFNRNEPRDIEYLFVGVIGEAKGLEAMRARFRNSEIVMIGRCATGVTVDFGRHLGHVPYAEIPRYMNRAKNFVFLPRWPEPQGRVVAEAALCGCQVIGNENVGALSFGMDLADPANYKGVEEDFWSRMRSVA